MTFGGAYSVLAYVTQVATISLGWLTRTPAVDGLALAETTPGPLIMVLQFVGFIAGWNKPGGHEPHGERDGVRIARVREGQSAAPGTYRLIGTHVGYAPQMVKSR